MAVVFGDAAPPEAEALSRRFRTAWTSFAATGDPGWPRYEPDGGDITHIFDVEPADVPGAEAASRRLWAGHRFDPLG